MPLGSHYKKTEDSGDGTGDLLPIVTIYFLNFCLDKNFPKVLQVAREYRDAVSGETVSGKNDFIESLTHDAYLIQIPLLDNNTTSDLERALGVFDQHYVIRGNKHRLLLKEVNEDDELVREMIRELEKAAADPKLDALFELEDEILYGQRKYKKQFEKEKAEKERAEAGEAKEKHRAEKLAKKLQELGVDPESL